MILPILGAALLGVFLWKKRKVAAHPQAPGPAPVPPQHFLPGVVYVPPTHRGFLPGVVYVPPQTQAGWIVAADRAVAQASGQIFG